MDIWLKCVQIAPISGHLPLITGNLLHTQFPRTFFYLHRVVLQSQLLLSIFLFSNNNSILPQRWSIASRTPWEGWIENWLQIYRTIIWRFNSRVDTITTYQASCILHGGSHQKIPPIAFSYFSMKQLLNLLPMFNKQHLYWVANPLHVVTLQNMILNVISNLTKIVW